ncbi:MAG: carbon starvation protein A [Planctomycetota bacterium]|nr:carbon starvation protein A [Planctomycetota bacterium]MDA1211366.1 carbon starvation protein A [Planctomycetota bacterium]
MQLITVVLFSAVVLSIAYRVYGRVLSRWLNLRPDVATPAVEMRDEVDFVPIDAKFLMGQHFSAIAAAGPIVGPILAGITFGWLPALIWILVGSIFIGGVHDMTSLVASIRHKARSIAEVVREHMTRRSYVLFLMFVWLALVYIIVAFTDVTARSFVGAQVLENGETITGGGIASSSLMYLILPLIMGCLLRYTKMGVGLATAIFLPLVGVSIVVGQWIPFDVGHIFGMDEAQALRVWNVSLLVYCVIASVMPMWLLLQPRGHLGGYFLYIALAAGMLGVIFGGKEIAYPAFRGWSVTAADGSTLTLFPLMFIMIACGACSGFHSIIASGTTSKQLRTEPDARVIGYGAMLLEAMVAVVSLCCVMMLTPDTGLLAGKTPPPNYIYAQGIGSFMQVIGVPAAFGVSFGLMAFTTFVYDTLDVCTRLGRYILQELFGWTGSLGRWVSTAITAGVPAIFLIWQPNSEKPAWRIFWDLFGASNQLLAALTLLGVTVWLAKTMRARWVWFAVGLPCAFMYVMSMWALFRICWPLLESIKAFAVSLAEGQPIWEGASGNPVPWVSMILIALGLLMLAEALRVFKGGWTPPHPSDSKVAATA